MLNKNEHFFSLFILSIPFLACLFFSCTTSPTKVTFDYRGEIDFKPYRYFHFFTPPNAPANLLDTDVYLRKKVNKKIQIALELNNLLLSYDPHESDFLIYSYMKINVDERYYESSNDKTQLPEIVPYTRIPPALSMKPVIRRDVYVTVIVNAILTIEIYDQKTRELLWQGVGKQQLSDWGIRSQNLMWLLTEDQKHHRQGSRKKELLWRDFEFYEIECVELLLLSVKKIVENFPPKQFF